VSLSSPFIVIISLISSAFVGWLSTRLPIPLVLLGFSIVGFLLIIKVRYLWLIIFSVGIHFDDLFIPLGPIKVGYGDVALILLLGYWGLWRFNRETPLHLPNKWPLILLYAVGTGLSWLQGPTPELITGLFIRNCAYVVGFFVLVDLLREEKQINIFIYVTLGSVALHILIGFYLDTGNRFGGLVDQPNIFGGLIGPGALIAILFASSQRFNMVLNGLFWCLSVLIVFGLVLTVSRGAQIAFIVALLWAFRRRWHLILIGLLVAGMIFQLVITIDPDRFNYFFRRWQLQDGSVLDRQTILLNTLRVIYEYPIFGMGFAQFTMLEDIMKIDSVHGRASHNHYLGEIATVGIPTITMLFGFIFYHARQLFKLDRIVEHNARLNILILQCLFIFQSVTLIFRGGRRMIEWTFLAVYTATVIIYHKKYQNSVLSAKTHP
jgi:hypothetical protein